MCLSLIGSSNNSTFSLSHNVLLGSEKALIQATYKSIYQEFSLTYVSALGLLVVQRNKFLLEKLTVPRLGKKFRRICEVLSSIAFHSNLPLTRSLCLSNLSYTIAIHLNSKDIS
jgi:hypothetical protein